MNGEIYNKKKFVKKLFIFYKLPNLEFGQGKLEQTIEELGYKLIPSDISKIEINVERAAMIHF
jgi:hypothetical protein